MFCHSPAQRTSPEPSWTRTALRSTHPLHSLTAPLYGNTGFTTATWNLGTGDYADFGFGIDSSLTVGKGWDNATGFGTPNGLTFINAVASSK